MGMREVVDDAGRGWLIYAIVPDMYDDRIGFAAGYSRGWLCFQCGDEKWRHLGIPVGWEALGDMELLEMMDEAIPVVRRTTRF
jgi:hypothetical protein